MQKEQHIKGKSLLKTFIQLVLFVGLGIFFIWLSLRSLSHDDIRSMLEAMEKINNPKSWLIISAAAAMAIFADFARAVRARILLEPLGYKPRLSMAFYSVMVCYLANLALPRLGEVLRCSFLQRFEDVPFQKSLGTVVTERVVDIICWLVLLVISIAVNTGILSELIVDQEAQQSLGAWLSAKWSSLVHGSGLYLLIAIIVVLAVTIRLTHKWWRKSRLCMKIRDFFLDLWHGIVSIKDLPNPWRFVFWTVMMWIAYFLGIYLCMLSIPYLHGIGPMTAFTILTFSTVAFIISQGGLGSFPLIVAGILFLYNIPYIQGLAAGWIGWIMQTVIVLVVGFLSLLLASFYKKTNNPTLKA